MWGHKEDKGGPSGLHRHSPVPLTEDCRVQLGGCPARTVSVGVDISYMDAFEEAFARKDSSWNVTGRMVRLGHGGLEAGVDSRSISKRDFNNLLPSCS